jgi:hypothetical protein
LSILAHVEFISISYLNESFSRNQANQAILDIISLLKMDEVFCPLSCIRILIPIEKINKVLNRNRKGVKNNDQRLIAGEALQPCRIILILLIVRPP